MGRVVAAGLVGGLVAFAWGTISWMALPWHSQTLRAFTDEVAVARVVREQAPQPGVYLLLPDHWATPTPEQRTIPKGFMLYGVLRHESPEMPIYYIRGLILMMVGAFLPAYLVSQTPLAGYWARVRFIAFVAFIAGVLTRLPDWHWWSFSTSHTLIGVCDLVLTWFLVGLVIARIVPTVR